MLKFDVNRLTFSKKVVQKIFGLVGEENNVQNARDRIKFKTFLKKSLVRFLNQDWGNANWETKKDNDFAVHHGGNILGIYVDEDDQEMWIVRFEDASLGVSVYFPEEIDI